MIHYWGLSNTGSHRWIFWGCLLALSYPPRTTDSQTPLTVLHVKVTATQPRSKAAAATLHTETLHQTFTTRRALWAARLPWQGPGCVAEIAIESFTDVFCTLTQLWIVLEDLKKPRKWSKHGEKRFCSNCYFQHWKSSYSFYKNQHGISLLWSLSLLEWWKSNT